MTLIPRPIRGQEERADLKDNNCSGFEDEPPLGIIREEYSMGGAASAVAWYGDYIYLAAMATVRVYHTPSDGEPQQVYEFELRDWAREMIVDGETLFIAARGDGLQAFDLSQDPAQPLPAGQVSGYLDVGGFSGVESIFNGVDAKGNKVAVARVNNVTRDQGGVDALVYDYDPLSDSFNLLHVIETEVRAKTDKEAPISVGLTDSGQGLYIGYGVLVGEVVYVPLDDPESPPVQAEIGSGMDIATYGESAFVALTGLVAAPESIGMLSRVDLISGTLEQTPIITNTGSGAGMSVALHDDLLCFGTWSPGRYEEGNNLWVFRELDAAVPARVGAAGTLDWIYQLACRDQGNGSGWAYVADEWGGLELWSSDGVSLTLDLESQRVPSGTLSPDLWVDGGRVYTSKEGAGLWYFDDGAPKDEAIAVEWIDTNDPGCACEGCCPPDDGVWSYPPAVFIGTGFSNQGKVGVIARNRDTAVAGQAYFMFFEETAGEYELIFSDPLESSDLFNGIWGSTLSTAHGEILFAAIQGSGLYQYQHCPGDPQEVRVLAEIEPPTGEAGMEFGDTAVYGDYLFVSEQHRIPLAEPDSGRIHVFRWVAGELGTCPDLPGLLNPPEYLGSFGEGMIPYKLALDPVDQHLYVSFIAKRTFPIIEGGVSSYDLSKFDPEAPAALDAYRTDLTPSPSMRVTYANVYDLLLDGGDLYITDRDNGLYRYSLRSQAYIGFYPAHRGPISEAYLPREMVQSPEGVTPLYHPVAMGLTPSGQVVVQEHVTGRVSIFKVERDVYLPLVLR